MSPRAIIFNNGSPACCVRNEVETRRKRLLGAELEMASHLTSAGSGLREAQLYEAPSLKDLRCGVEAQRSELHRQAMFWVEGKEGNRRSETC